MTLQDSDPRFSIFTDLFLFFCEAVFFIFVHVLFEIWNLTQCFWSVPICRTSTSSATAQRWNTSARSTTTSTDAETRSSKRRIARSLSFVQPEASFLCTWKTVEARPTVSATTTSRPFSVSTDDHRKIDSYEKPKEVLNLYATFTETVQINV